MLVSPAIVSQSLFSSVQISIPEKDHWMSTKEGRQVGGGPLMQLFTSLLMYSVMYGFQFVCFN